jgi:predicted ABC-type ATPase
MAPVLSPARRQLVAFVFVTATPKKARKAAPRCIVIAGPNGAGKTTFAQEFLPNYAGIVEFVNADLIAEGLSPFRPRDAAIRAGRLMLLEIDRLASRRADFAIESTLSGLTFLSRWKHWKAMGYRIEVIYLTLPSADVAVRRIALRVQQGGHAVPKTDVLRRFERSWRNFCEFYRPMADAWMVYDNSGNTPRLIETGP